MYVISFTALESLANLALQKLQPFFPPHEQLQSLNLRNALFRCLEQAKKNGALGRDTLLRKTMLDECKGDRVEEVLAVFSNAVLKRVIQSASCGEHPALAQQLALENFSYHGERATLASLILAHKASLGKHMRNKEEVRAKYNDFSSLLDLNDRRIARRHEQLKQIVEDNGSRDQISGKEATIIQGQVQMNWSGKSEWLEGILFGDSKAHAEGLLSTRFDKVWKHVEARSIGDMEDKSGAGLLEQLEARVKNQESRLARWQDFGRTMSTAKPQNLTPKKEQLASEGQKLDLGFNLHQTLQIGRKNSEEPVQSTSTSLEEYSRLTDNMRSELSQVGRPQVQLQPTPRRAIQLELHSSQLDGTPEGTTQLDEGWSSASDSDEFSPGSLHLTASTPSRPPTSGPRTLRRGGQNLADRSSSTPTPRFKPQALLSPNKSAVKRTESSPFTRANPQTPGSVGLPPTPLANEIKLHQDSGAMGPLPTPSFAVDTESHPNPLSTGSLTTPLVFRDSESDLADAILDSMTAASPSPRKQRHTLSLAERTRLSMSRASHSQVSDLQDEFEILDVSRLSIRSRPMLSPQITSEANSGLHEDLMERTKKSMAGFEMAQKKAQLERRRSVKDEKKKARQGSYFPKVEEEQSLTPDISAIELMEGDPDYESVFKSRPKIKTSPAVSPMRSFDSLQ